MKSRRSFGKPRKRNKLIILRRVNGNSMRPTLHHGQLVVGHVTRELAAGDVVIVSHNGLEKIKRIERHEGDLVYLLGDNPAESTDSRTLGWLPAQTIIAKVIWPHLSSEV